MKPLRLFFALWPPEELRERLWRALAPLRRARPGVRWIPPERYHVTLRFLGDIPATRLPSLRLAADTLARQASFRLRFTGSGVFPPRGPARVYWIGLGPAPLTRFHRILDGALERQGFAPRRRPFRPHLTVGRARPERGAARRVRDGGDDPVPAIDESFTIRAVHLVRSELFADGPKYANIHRVDLSGRRE